MDCSVKDCSYNTNDQAKDADISVQLQLMEIHTNGNHSRSRNSAQTTELQPQKGSGGVIDKLKSKLTDVFTLVKVDKSQCDQFKIKFKEALVENWIESSHCNIVRGVDPARWPEFIEHFQKTLKVPEVKAVLEHLEFGDDITSNVRMFSIQTTDVKGIYGMIYAAKNATKIDVAYAIFDLEMKILGPKKKQYTLYNLVQASNGLFKLGEPVVEDLLTGRIMKGNQGIAVSDADNLAQNYIIEKAMIAFHQAGFIPKLVYSHEDKPLPLNNAPQKMIKSNPFPPGNTRYNY